MTTRSGARVYRGASTPVAPGCCGACGQRAGVTRRGLRREHTDTDGRPCTGSGVRVRATTPVQLDDLPDVQMPTGRSYTRRPAAAKAAEPADPGRCVCGRSIPFNKDGSRRAHRVTADSFTAPYCTEGGDPRRSLRGC